MTNVIKTILFAGPMLMACAAFCQQGRTAAAYTNVTECLGVEGDGSQTVKAHGVGRNRQDAVEQARKNAVRDVIFRGLREGKPDCEKRPILPEVNAQEKYVDYFNNFFADGGPYRDFVSAEDERLASRITREKQRGRNSVSHSFIVRVKRSEIVKRLEQDGILNR
jgi:hypothetical protein